MSGFLHELVPFASADYGIFGLFSQFPVLKSGPSKLPVMIMNEWDLKASPQYEQTSGPFINVTLYVILSQIDFTRVKVNRYEWKLLSNFLHESWLNPALVEK